MFIDFTLIIPATGKSFSEALILASTNPQYDKRMFIDLPVQYMETKSSEQVVYTNCFLFLTYVLTFTTIYVHTMSYYGLIDTRIGASDKKLPVLYILLSGCL